jgi:hypothetical protein
MTAGREKYIAPSLNLTAFNCPHCHVLTTQTWYAAHAEPLGRAKTPLRWTPEQLAEQKFDDIEDSEKRRRVRTYFTKLSLARPFLWNEQKHVDYMVPNASISVCFDCLEPTFWIGNNIAWPESNEAPSPNPDLPEQLRVDYEEAANIISRSPRGAAALLRLVIQKLCVHLGGKGEHLDTDIAMLVGSGLDPRVKQALDVVRVIGNNAVHPGKIDLRDDPGTAGKLFGLVNLIVEIMISQPKHVQAMYDSLPEGSRKAIEKRDAK